ncbi:MAG: orotidine-5'-phosphate decarboxylase [Bacteroidales bacterium]|jgi:orotidine-5'-phosphate decarboxylase|nr:orotidine-5'-phosphate decarboxylase [Bacteroidales bacterium]
MDYDSLYRQIKEKKSFLCVGLDPDPALFPAVLRNAALPIYEFNKAIINNTARYAVAYKPNLAFYEANGIKGMIQLDMTIKYIRDNFPKMFIIADAKRGDICNTAFMYAKAYFETMDFDAITVAPYMGADSVQPFLKYKDKWTIVLALTSNASASDLEMCEVREKEGIPDMPIYERVIRNTIPLGNRNNLMFVIGATRPEKLREIRKYCPDNFLLVPGVGAQGGTIKDVAENGLNDKCGLLVNSSRGIIYADDSDLFGKAAGRKAKALAEQMAEYL